MEEVDFAGLENVGERLLAFGKVTDCAEDACACGLQGTSCLDTKARGGSGDKDNLATELS